MRYNLESTLPINAFSPRGGRGPFNYGMTLEGGGGGGFVGDIVGGIGDAFSGIGDAIGSVGVAIDEGVNDIVPGGWGTLGTIAAAVAAPYLLPTLSAPIAAGIGAAAARGVEGGVKGKDWEDTLKSMAISGGTAYAAGELFGSGVEGGEGGVNDLGAGSSGYGEANELFVPPSPSPDPFIPDVPMPDVYPEFSPDVSPEFSPDIPRDFDYVPATDVTETLVNQLANTSPNYVPRDFDYIAEAASVPSDATNVLSEEQKRLFEQGMQDLQNRSTVNVAGEPRFTEDPFKYLSNQGQDAATYLRDTPLSEMGEDAYNLVRRNPLETAGIALVASNLMGGQQQPQPQGSPSQDAYDGKYTGGYGGAGSMHDPYSLRNRVNAQNVYGYSSPISRYADGGEVKHFGLGGLSNAITRFTQPIEKAIIRPIGDAVPFLRDAAPYAGLLAAPFIASPAMAAGVGALSSGFGRPGSGFNMKRAMMGGIAAYGMSNLGSGLEAAGSAPLTDSVAIPNTDVESQIGGFYGNDGTTNQLAGRSGNFNSPSQMYSGIKNLAGGSTYGPAAAQFATKAGLPSAGMALMGTSGVMAVDEGIEQQKAADAAAAVAKGENQEFLNRIAAGKKRAQDAVKANPYMYAMGGSVDDEYGMDEARGLMTGNLQNGFMGGMPSYAAGGMPNLALSRLSQPAFNEGAVGGMPQFAAGGTPRFLSGGGDGMSDSIPATIEGNQEARLADGEFVIPADVVSHLGNGSSKAGAKQLYSMMDRVRQARVGTKKQGREIKPKKFMPV